MGILLAFAIFLSRVILGVHFPADILAGWAAGVIVFALVIGSEQRVSPALARAGFPVQVAVTVIVSWGILGAQAVILLAITPVIDPPIWMALADRAAPISPRDPTNLVMLAGALPGVGVGFACQSKWARFAVSGVWWKKGLRLMVGGIGLFFFYGGLSLAFPAMNFTAGLV